MERPRPYDRWRTEPNERWRDAFHAFGHLLMTHARDGALANLPKSASAESCAIAAKAVDEALYNVMMIVAGVVGPSRGDGRQMEFAFDEGVDPPADHGRQLEFALVARVRETEAPRRVVEEFELAPNGEESACMGFHFWAEGDFRA